MNVGARATDIARRAAAVDDGGCWMDRDDGYPCGDRPARGRTICAVHAAELAEDVAGEHPPLVACPRPHCWWAGSPEALAVHRQAQHGETTAGLAPVASRPTHGPSRATTPAGR